MTSDTVHNTQSTQFNKTQYLLEQYNVHNALYTAHSIRYAPRVAQYTARSIQYQTATSIGDTVTQFSLVLQTASIQ